MQWTGHAFLQHFSAAATIFTALAPCCEERHRSRVAKGWNQGGFLTWFVFLCLFILGALTWQQADWRLWTGNCNRAKSTAKSQLKMPGTGPSLSMSVLSDKNSTFSVHNTHFPLHTSCYSGIVLQKMLNNLFLMIVSASCHWGTAWQSDIFPFPFSIFMAIN